MANNEMFSAQEAHKMSEEMLKNNPDVQKAFGEIRTACQYGYYKATVVYDRKARAEFVASILRDWGYTTEIRFGFTMWHIDITW